VIDSVDLTKNPAAVVDRPADLRARQDQARGAPVRCDAGPRRITEPFVFRYQKFRVRRGCVLKEFRGFAHKIAVFAGRRQDFPNCTNGLSQILSGGE
jgi:hypothetical protein